METHKMKCKHCGTPDPRLERCLAFITSLTRLYEGELMPDEIWSEALYVQDGIDYADASIALKARELLKELEA